MAGSFERAFGSGCGVSMGIIVGLGCGLVLLIGLTIGGCSLLVGGCAVAVPEIQEAGRRATDAAQRQAEGKKEVEAAELRTWSDPSGKFTRVARFIDLDGEIVRLEKADGGIVTVPLRQLSVSDQQWVAKHKTP